MKKLFRLEFGSDYLNVLCAIGFYLVFSMIFAFACNSIWGEDKKPAIVFSLEKEDKFVISD
jgi:hypothetical protein